MRLPKDTNCVCTQHAMLEKGEQIKHGRKHLQLKCGVVSQRTSSRGGYVVPTSKPAKAESVLTEPQFRKGLLTKVGMGSAAFPYDWIRFQASPRFNMFTYPNGKGLRWELLVLTHEQKSSCVRYGQQSPGTRSFMGCDGAGK